MGILAPQGGADVVQRLGTAVAGILDDQGGLLAPFDAFQCGIHQARDRVFVQIKLVNRLGPLCIAGAFQQGPQ